MGTFSLEYVFFWYQSVYNECSDRLGKRGLKVTRIYKCIRKSVKNQSWIRATQNWKKKISSSRAPPYWLLFCSIKLTHSLNCLLSINSINNFPSFQWTVSKFNENNWLYKTVSYQQCFNQEKRLVSPMCYQINRCKIMKTFHQGTDLLLTE